MNACGALDPAPGSRDLEVSLDNADAVIEGFGILGEAELASSVVAGGTEH